MHQLYVACPGHIDQQALDNVEDLAENANIPVLLKAEIPQANVSINRKSSQRPTQQPARSTYGEALDPAVNQRADKCVATAMKKVPLSAIHNIRLIFKTPPPPDENLDSRILDWICTFSPEAPSQSAAVFASASSLAMRAFVGDAGLLGLHGGNADLRGLLDGNAGLHHLLGDEGWGAGQVAKHGRVKGSPRKGDRNKGLSDFFSEFGHSGVGGESQVRKQRVVRSGVAVSGREGLGVGRLDDSVRGRDI
ncbi:hypothetical protein BDK51DRAFT_46033 [Blyttiomyces helicus]|uniref:Uncharacterized protein n=1 Tax=Blyttiomyces helicus TaxID=388810 RepID=A0A4P9WN10_9FUNG|nr:hypothetical protein BDK51DRAFT_46033 [Blyttiomyces helicus]|eukprot:RKO93433.1 hypothetical protein BDK51DRAFT_46033 [Blyttiomyces helicus]